MAIASFEDCFLFIIFANCHLIINIGEVKLDKTSCLAKLIQ